MRQLTQADLIIALDACASLLGKREFIVVGSVSIVGSIPEPSSGLAVSLDIDLFPPPDGALDITEAVAMHLGDSSPFQFEHGFYVESVGRWTMSTALDGWEDRLVRVITPNGVVGLCLSPLDLDYVKLDARRDKDLQYVGLMLRAGIISRESLIDAITSKDADTIERMDSALKQAEHSRTYERSE